MHLHISAATTELKTGFAELTADSELGTHFVQVDWQLDLSFVQDSSFQRFGGYRLETSGEDGNTVIVRYFRVCDAFRAVGRLLRSNSVQAGHGGMSEECCFRNVGVMIDISRNAVLRPEYVLFLLRRFALLGINQVMLYSEDTYEIVKQPFFGYKRGRYSSSDIRRFDACAVALGIELIPCIQTLGHLSQILQWPAYDGIRDQQDVLLAGCDDTYELISRMLDSILSCFSSKRVHIGNDVTGFVLFAFRNG